MRVHDLHVRRAHPLDQAQMARLLNEIIATGGTTAMTEPVTAEDIAGWTGAARAAWHVAEIEAEIVGFQWIEPLDDARPEVANIATFVKSGRTGSGIGGALFAATAKAARKLGYAWINANIRADNEQGLTYYQSRGFRDWRRVEGVQLADGMVVDKIWKRFDLD